MGAGGGGRGPDAHPELVEALFRLMEEWVKEVPVPSLRLERGGGIEKGGVDKSQPARGLPTQKDAAIRSIKSDERADAETNYIGLFFAPPRL